MTMFCEKSTNLGEANTPRSYILNTNSGEVRINRRHLVKAELNDDKNSNDDKLSVFDIVLSSGLPQSADPPKQTNTQPITVKPAFKGHQ